jgi:hypothetical protein
MNMYPNTILYEVFHYAYIYYIDILLWYDFLVILNARLKAVFDFIYEFKLKVM